MEFKFPKDFIFGTATASYQIEGARENLDKCIWDDFAKMPGRVFNHDDGKLACDSYNRLDEDIELLKQLHFKAYRFSISWTRIINNGTGNVREEGIAYYRKLINKLKENQIEPFVTIYHWDLPSVLQEKGGWSNDEIVDWFEYYCKVIFENFGYDVPYFITINEPYCIANLGYGEGVHAPGLKDLSLQLKASINLLKAHGIACRLFKKMNLPGKIGINLNINDIVPINEKAIKACQFIKDTTTWWYFYPLFTGKFKQETVDYFKSLNAMPSISDEEMQLITTKGDFIGLNHYNVTYYDENCNVVERNDLPKNGLGWIIDPLGLYRVLKEISSYTDMDIYILENGYGSGEVDYNLEINDDVRVNYYKDYLNVVCMAINDGIKVKSYFAWSLLDNYEWAEGYSKRFGLVYVDFKTLKRTLKKSALYLKEVADSLLPKKLIFNETFEGNELNRDVWNVTHSSWGGGNNEFQFYADKKDNLKVENNTLKLIGIKEKYEGKEYTSAKITSKQGFKYGRFEVVCKVPKGKGSWPAVWMMPLDRSLGWPMCGEIDIVETVGKNQDVMHFSLHTGKYNHPLNNQRTKFLHVKGASDEFLTYTMDWTKDFILFKINGSTWAKFENPDPKFPGGIESWPFDKEFYFICNNAIGGNWGGEVDETKLPNQFEIKSIKVYQWDD